MSKGTLVLVRHGESRFNELNLFTGCVDVSLTEKGIEEAHKVAEHCKPFNYDTVFTSYLKRAQETLLIILSGQEKMGIFQHQKEKQYEISPKAIDSLKDKIISVYLSDNLNERSYGDLQGLNKNEATEQFGNEQILKWRRGFKDRPPKGESLEDVYNRVVPYFLENILPGLKQGESNLLVAHGNTLRALIKYLENIDDDKISFVNLPLAYPLVYEYSGGSFRRIEGDYDYERPLR